MLSLKSNNNEKNIYLWIKNNTFHYLDNINFKYLYDNKKGRTISVILPTLNEEKTIESIIDKIIEHLYINFKIVDEIIVIDDDSIDNTQKILEKCEIVKYYQQKEILKFYKKKGKGNQLWKGLYCSRGDIIIYCDTDIREFNINMIYGLILPLLINDIKFVKGFYNRGQGGRVTEICARPIINSFYPELAGFIQPLAGEYGCYRNILENIRFMSGYSVEIIILIEIYKKYGINIMGQSNLKSRIHKENHIQKLSIMSFKILISILEENNINYQSNLFYNQNQQKIYNIENNILPPINSLKNQINKIN